MKTKLMSDLWNKAEGCFYNHIDLQNIKHMHHYYTDHVFPTLYTGLDTLVKWQSLNSPYGSFSYNPGNNTPKLIELGRSDPDSRQTISSNKYPSGLLINIGAKTSEIDLLYITEVECRNTGTRVGEIALIYENGHIVSIPLVVGSNIDFLTPIRPKMHFLFS